MELEDLSAVITCDDDNIQIIHRRLDDCHSVLNHYKWLIDAFVLDFFTENHWSKLTDSVGQALDRISPEELGRWILKPSGECTYSQHVFPLSLLALKAFSQTAMLNRQAVTSPAGIAQYLEKQKYGVQDCHLNWDTPLADLTEHSGQLQKLGQVFKKHVKPKKQHEIFRLSKACAMIARATDCQCVVDAGAGIGHLSRHLTYCHGLRVVCLESQEQFGQRADKLDDEIREACLRQGITCHSKPNHITVMLSPTTSNLAEVLSSGTDQPKEEFSKFGLVGLHTCGDLGPTLIRNFAQNSEIKFIAVVGCCYMKIDLTRPLDLRGYPMSSFMQRKEPSFVSYEALEVSCHAIETYCDRLAEFEADKLKVHCYRATLETLLVRLDPPVRRAGLRSVKRAHLLSFQDYTRQALHKMDIHINQDDLSSEYIEACLSQWKRVVAFYTLRLILAPIIETVIQLDRLVYIKEKGLNGILVPLFDCRLSPRNYTLLSVKPKAQPFPHN